MENINTCKFCSKILSNCYENHSNQTFKIECPACGVYRITREALGYNFSRIPEKDLFLFSGYLRNNSSPENPMLITSEICNKISTITLPFDQMPVLEKVNNILKYIYGSTTKVLGEVYININDIYRFYLRAPGDMNTILEYLKIRKLIRWGENEGIFKCILTIEGWERYEQIKNEITNINSKQAFVAMSFDENLRDMFENGMVPAAKECGFDAVRVDSQEHNDKICDRIIAEINRSRFVIADFTQNKHGVYFEAGYALGLGIPVIWTCLREYQEKEGLHFDTRQYNHILWENKEDLKIKLIPRINSTVNRPLTRNST